MAALNGFGRLMGWSCIAIGGMQILGGVRVEPGMEGDATVDSHLRFMGAIFAGYGLNWLASSREEPDLGRMRLLAGLMAVGGASRLATRASIGRPHRFHDLLLGIEVAAPAVVEVLARRDARAG
ncbi:DUF4345 domain-containing protein [Nocardioides sambongensis]|uniref:DUF4345 domain-containing protein n=1 Tax=Nocardioides sambongensis TaxID=2589074 RepID=UPI0015E838BE|nr:DUF4345 domain-containing protein [Nocardioides sambongensis]